MYACLVIVCVSLCAAVLSEAISYALVYRHDSWKKLTSSIDALAAKIDKKKETAPVAGKKPEKKLQQLELQLSTKQAELSRAKMTSMIAVSATLMLTYNVLSNVYDGVVVANLPFTPFPLIQGISHRRLSGSDMTECSFAFLYLLSSMALRQSVQRYFGFAPKTKATSSFFNPPQQPGAASPW